MDKIEDLYCQDNGRPTKDLRSVTGAIILQHMHNLSDLETCEKYEFDNLWFEALGLANVMDRDLSISPKTLWNHSEKLATSGLLQEILDSVNQNLATVAKVDFRCQRLDSTHVCSNMAKLSRIQLFYKIVKKFLVSLKKGLKDRLVLVDKAVLDRYLSEDSENSNSSYNFFGQTKSGERGKNLDSVAADMYTLIALFEDDKAVTKTMAFQNLVRVFSEQCVVDPDCCDEATKVKAKDPKLVPSNSLQNPSDPEATYSGHKGQGYQVQLMETCSETKEEGEKSVNLITYVKFEQAHEHDSHALLPAIEETENSGVKPEIISADTAYGSDENVQKAEELGVKVISPVGGKDPEVGKIRLAEFTESEDGKTITCPLGQKSWQSHQTEKGTRVAGFDLDKCRECANNEKCPAFQHGHKAELKFTSKDMRLSQRRANEQTEEFKKRYAMRSGIEATNSRLKRQTGFNRLRYRGKKKPRMSVTFKVIGVNFWRVLESLRPKKVAKAA
jgi:IS5 family transposase